ncbi:MAG: nucleotidyl transferase AbiEii/AbiGii toxin family protein [Verrucomicrobiae bacterium]|nr:nucleotidyl transferase AbiEii/AbiGii toxin family protein [Verrucomicrobiae bacterium]
MRIAPDLPDRHDIERLARWVFRHPLIREHYALGGGAWLTLRHPQAARVSRDVDVFSTREEVSSYAALMEIVRSCERQKIRHRIARRGEHFCEIFIEYPTTREIKIEIGKIWRPIQLFYDSNLRCPILSPADLVREKLQCVVDRREPTDLFDLTCLHELYPAEFRSALEGLAEHQEAGELLAAIHRLLETTEGEGTKESLTAAQRRWLERRAPALITWITAACRRDPISRSRLGPQLAVRTARRNAKMAGQRVSSSVRGRRGRERAWRSPRRTRRPSR